MTTTLEAIRAKCIEANPEKATRNESLLLTAPFSGIITRRDDTIRLADVLLAIGEYCISAAVILVDRNNAARWNLREDDLENQSPETIAFLGKVLDIRLST